jgi:hypothetical protein
MHRNLASSTKISIGILAVLVVSFGLVASRQWLTRAHGDADAFPLRTVSEAILIESGLSIESASKADTSRVRVTQAAAEETALKVQPGTVLETVLTRVAWVQDADPGKPWSCVCWAVSIRPKDGFRPPADPRIYAWPPDADGVARPPQLPVERHELGYHIELVNALTGAIEFGQEQSWP